MIGALDNALACQKRILRQSECLFSHVRDIAYGLLFEDGEIRYGEDIFENDTLADEYNAAVTAVVRTAGETEKAATEIKSLVTGAFQNVKILSEVCLCSAICELLAENGRTVRLDGLFGDMSEPENSKIAYMRNPYSDMAYREFERALGQATVLYPDSFSAVCEEVYNGRAGYCILPYESSDDGALYGFLKLIDKYELAPVMTVRIVTNNGQDEQKTISFVLLAKNVKRISPELEAKGVEFEEYLKISVDAGGNGVLDVMNAAGCCGLSHVKTESIPVMWDSGRYVFSLTFRVDGAGLLPFLLWLKLSMPEATPHAVYAYLLF